VLQEDGSTCKTLGDHLKARNIELVARVMRSTLRRRVEALVREADERAQEPEEIPPPPPPHPSH